MKKVTSFIISIFAVLSLSAQEQDSLLTQANQLYVDGNYQEATETYQKIIDLGYESSELYYNLGNAYYKQNVISRAILNYEKALELDPNDEDIKYNIELANRFVVDKIEVLPVFFITGWIRSIRNIFCSNTWAILSILMFIAMLVFLAIYLYTRGLGVKRVAFWLGFVLFIGSLVSFIFSYQQKQKILSENTAIVMSPSVTVKSSPDASGTDLFVIHEGTKVWIDDKISNWNQIKLSDGSKGWLRAEDIETI
ncbi:MAG: tetratricopeptide repeat protein [Bacteroidetes bacterium]|nr:tetratricopeptide repeat protein [Bacteroidota bacterium]